MRNKNYSQRVILDNDLEDSNDCSCQARTEEEEAYGYMQDEESMEKLGEVRDIKSYLNIWNIMG